MKNYVIKNDQLFANVIGKTDKISTSNNSGFVPRIISLILNSPIKQV